MVAETKDKRDEIKNKWTTICVDRKFKQKLEQQMEYGDSYQSYLKSNLPIFQE